MSRIGGAAVAALVVVSLASCTDDSRERASETAAVSTPSPSPTPRPALSQRAAQAVVLSYATRIAKANRTLDRALAAKVQTGSALQVSTAQYVTFKRNKLRYWATKYTSAVAAAPLFSGHPRWFFAAATDRGAAPATRDFLVLVQQKAGDPWRVAYAPTSRTPAGPLAPGVDVADAPATVPPDDERLLVSPRRLPAEMAKAVDPSRGRSMAAVEAGRWVTASRTSLHDNRAAYTESGWTGESRAVPGSTPVYALRTTSGGALVWFSVNFRHSYDRTRGKGTGMTWVTEQYGDLHNGFGVPSTVERRISRVERNEIVAYVPPKGKGKIRVLANRWFPVQLEGA